MEKTAEEILQHHYVHNKGLNNPQYVIEAMKEYARLACDKQRTLCMNHAQCSDAWEIDGSSILNAPEPDLK
jgi:hypothetical protein